MNRRGSHLMKFIGCMFILSGSLGLGCWYGQEFKRRLNNLRDIGHIMEMMISEIKYGKSTLPDCCRKLTGKTKEPFKSTFSQIHQSVKENSGEKFSEIYGEHMKKCVEKLSLKKVDQEIIVHLAEKGSFEDGEMQIRSIEQALDIIKSTVKQLEAEINEKSRMAVGLGAMSGLLLMLILL